MKKLSKGAWALLKFVISFTGEKELGPQGQEVNSARKLSNENSCQRGHFMKKINPILEEMQSKLEEEQEAVNKELEALRKLVEKKNPKKKDEKKEVYDMRINRIIPSEDKFKEMNEKFNKKLEDLNNEQVELDLTDKTVSVLKRYFDEYGDIDNEKGPGYSSGDDERVAEIMEVLK